MASVEISKKIPLWKPTFNEIKILALDYEYHVGIFKKLKRCLRFGCLY